MTIESSPQSVSVVVATRNDRRFIRDCLDSLLEQDTSIDELIVLDCGSTDGTQELVSKSADVTKLVQNVALEEIVGISERLSRGNVICVADAKALYAKNAFRACLQAVQHGDAEAGPGRPIPVGTTNFGRAVAAVERWLAIARPAVTCWSRPPEPAPGNSHRVYAAVRCWRYAPATAAELARESFRAGADGRSHHLRRADPRTALPAMVILASGISALLGRRWRRFAVPLAHGAFCVAVAVTSGRDPGVAPHRAFLALEVGHWSTGAGVCRRLAGGPRSRRSP